MVQCNFDADDLMLSQDNNQDYKLVLSMKEDRIVTFVIIDWQSAAFAVWL